MGRAGVGLRISPHTGLYYVLLCRTMCCTKTDLKENFQKFFYYRLNNGITVNLTYCLSCTVSAKCSPFSYFKQSLLDQPLTTYMKNIQYNKYIHIPDRELHHRHFECRGLA